MSEYNEWGSYAPPSQFADTIEEARECIAKGDYWGMDDEEETKVEEEMQLNNRDELTVVVMIALIFIVLIALFLERMGILQAIINNL